MLEHNTVIWSPYKVGDNSSIEKVQRRFTKRLLGLKNLTYKQRLVATNLGTLELRRLCTDLVVCYKIVFGLIKVDVNIKRLRITFFLLHMALYKFLYCIVLYCISSLVLHLSVIPAVIDINYL